MDKSIAFIICVNDTKQYEESARYINNLRMPEGFEKEIIAVSDSKSMTSAYNYAMNKSKSKYKVYMHQDTMIINKNFIYDILNIFSDDKVGMIGTIGCKQIPVEAVWWNSNRKVGKVYEGSEGYINLLDTDANIDYSINEVQAVDGFIMITQYDIPWREDIFDGYHFYNISQCIEFRERGLKVVVPYQEKPWILHDCKIPNWKMYDFYKQKFLKEYSHKIYPLVSVLIPTYNRPHFFELALKSVLDQTYKHIEIIICDDSTNNETELVARKYAEKFSNIKYYKNKERLGQFDNDLKLMSLANGRYINILMDDDLFKKDKIEKMMKYFIMDDKNEISLVTSNREMINDDGEFIRNFVNDDLISRIGDSIIGGSKLCGFILATNLNIIGEPTTVLFDRTKLTEEFGVYNGRRYICNVDQATWYNLLDNGKAVFIKEPLSCFRISDSQQSSSEAMLIGGMQDYSFSIENAMKNGHITSINSYYKAVVFYTYEGDQIITKKSAINIWKICKSGSSLLHPFFCCF